MKENYRELLLGIAAKLLGVCQATLRIWERKGLIKPARLGKNRFYSRCDLDRLEKIKELIQKKHINIEGVKTILETVFCWQVKRCPEEIRNRCPVYQNALQNSLS